MDEIPMGILPMMCKPTTHAALTDKSWIEFSAEPKHDGMRALVIRGDNDTLEIVSRTGKSQIGKHPHLEEVFRELPEGTILDGELAVIDRWEVVCDVRVPIVNFNKTMRICGSKAPEAQRKNLEGPVSFLTFDALWHEGADITYLTWANRRPLARELLNAYLPWPHVVLNPAWRARNYKGLCQAVEKAGCEGLILKRRDSAYTPGKRPNNTWYKVKKEQTFDVVFMGCTPGQGKYAGQIGAVEFGAYNEGRLVLIGKCSGMTDVERASITAKQAALKGRVFVVKSNDMVGSGKYQTPRHPNFLYWRDDKLPAECSVDQFLNPAYM